MQSSNAPSKIQLPFAASGTKNTIPVPSQQGVTPGAASFTDGFPPLTFTPLSAGGIPPAGGDFNGVLNAITALQQWQSGGGIFKYDATFSGAVGGYALGAIVAKANGSGYWRSTVENNMSNPDTGGAGWVGFDPLTAQSGAYNTASDTGSANAYAISLAPAPSALTPGMIVSLQNAVASNTGASTLNVNSTGALPIVSAGGQAMQGGEIVASYGAILRLNKAGNAWELVFTSGGAMPVATGSQSRHALQLGQLIGNLVPNGYLKIPVISSGSLVTLILQWGVAAATTVGVQVNFPIPFPTFLFGVYPVNNNQTSGTVCANQTSLSKFVFSASANGSNYWFAIGM